jgi:hypothetical protein
MTQELTPEQERELEAARVSSSGTASDETGQGAANLSRSEDSPQGSPQGNGSGDARATLLATLREKREANKAEHHLDLDLPGYDGLMVARFRPFPVEKTERKMAEFQKLQGKQPILLKVACDTLIDACEQVLLRKEEGAEPFPIDDEAMPPIGFDSRLSELLEFKADSARQVVLGIFPTEQSILAMNARVSQWMADVTSETDRGLLGES